MAISGFVLSRPAALATSAVFASPHSGRDYPGAFLARTVLDERAIRSSEDAFVDILLESAPQFGAPLLTATVPRAFIDLNRADDELDPSLIDDVGTNRYNPRIASGLGVIPRVVSGARPIYSGKLRLREAEARIERYWRPYHDCLKGLLTESRARFGESILIDMHSMPHEAIEVHADGRRADIVIGDRFGASAAPEIVAGIETAFSSRGLRVARNAPFAGAYMTQAYGRPSHGRHAVQVEIDRALYMDEATIAPSAGFADFRRLMAEVVAEIAAMGGRAMRLAAE